MGKRRVNGVAEARRKRLALEELVDRELDRLIERVEQTRFEFKRLLGIAESEHRACPRPARYWKKE